MEEQEKAVFVEQPKPIEQPSETAVAQNPIKSRKLSYDVIRIVAVCMVLMVHVSGYMVLYHTDPTSREFVVGNIFNGISRAGVPLFLMLTGALLLNEDKAFNPKTFYKTSFVWMALLLVGWTVAYGAFYAIAFPLLHHQAVDWSGVPLSMWNYAIRLPTMYPHLWYLFMVVGLYLMIPVLRLFVKRENKNYILGIILAFVLVKLLPVTFAIFTRNSSTTLAMIVDKFHLEPVTGFLGYVLTGWYITNVKLIKPLRRTLYLLALLAVITAILTVQNNIQTDSAVRSWFYEPLTLPSFLYGLGLFVLLEDWCGKRQTKSRFVKMLSKNAFGVYIIHAFWMEMLTMWVSYWDFKPQNPLLYMELLFAACVVLCYVSVWVLSLIPGVKKIFYLK